MNKEQINFKIDKKTRYIVEGKLSEGLIAVRDTLINKVGYANENLEIVIPCTFKNGFDFNDGLAKVQEPETNLCGFINKSGELVYPYIHNLNNFFSEGLAKVQDPITKLYGFKDKSGDLVIPYMYADAGDFSEGLAWVINPDTGLTGYIDHDNNVKIPFRDITQARSFRDGRACVCDRIQKYSFIDKDGRFIITGLLTPPSDFSDGRSRIMDNWYDGEYGYIDENGKAIIEYKYGYAENFMDGVAVVSQRKYSFEVIDRNGKTLGEAASLNEAHKLRESIIGKKEEISINFGTYYVFEISLGEQSIEVVGNTEEEIKDRIKSLLNHLEEENRDYLDYLDSTSPKM
jgi:hypothetical protein